MPKELSFDRLVSLLRYEPETGVFRWKVSKGRALARSIAGSAMPAGYITIGIDGVSNYAHRLAVLYMTGKHPSDQVDHINGDKSDNRWSNLRDVTARINSQNQRLAKSDNKVGLLGVHVDKRTGSFVAILKHDGRQIYAGAHQTAEEAHQSYIRMKRIHHEGNTL